jgi:hypothetical protein
MCMSGLSENTCELVSQHFVLICATFQPVQAILDILHIEESLT